MNCIEENEVCEKNFNKNSCILNNNEKENVERNSFENNYNNCYPNEKKKSNNFLDNEILKSLNDNFYNPTNFNNNNEENNLNKIEENYTNYNNKNRNSENNILNYNDKQYRNNIEEECNPLAFPIENLPTTIDDIPYNEFKNSTNYKFKSTSAHFADSLDMPIMDQDMMEDACKVSSDSIDKDMQKENLSHNEQTIYNSEEGRKESEELSNVKAEDDINIQKEYANHNEKTVYNNEDNLLNNNYKNDQLDNYGDIAKEEIHDEPNDNIAKNEKLDENCNSDKQNANEHSPNNESEDKTDYNICNSQENNKQINMDTLNVSPPEENTSIKVETNNCDNNKPEKNEGEKKENDNQDNVNGLNSQIRDLQNVVENMKKEKIHLLSKFKVYTLNNKKEIEELKVICKNNEEEIKKYIEEIKNKSLEIENMKEAYSNDVNVFKNSIKKEKELNYELIEKYELLNKTKEHIEKEIEQIRENNESIKMELKAKEQIINMLENEKKEEIEKGKRFANIDINDQDELLALKMDAEILVCFKKNNEYFIIPKYIFEENFKNIKIPDPVQENYEKKLKEYKDEQILNIKKLEEEKIYIENEYNEYKVKVNSLINETSENYKSLGETNIKIQDLKNDILKYEQDIKNYKTELNNLNEKYKLIHQQLCKEKELTEEQNATISSLKKQSKKEKVEIEKKYKELFDIENQKKIAEIKEMYNNKEKLLQDKIEDLIYQIEKLTFPKDDKTTSLRSNISKLDTPLNDISSTDDSIEKGSIHNQEKKNRSNSVLTVNKNSVSEMNEQGSVGGESAGTLNNDCINRTGENVENGNEKNNKDKIKQEDDTKIPIYPNEYKKIRKKLETYEILIDEEKKEKKKLLEQINTLTSQVKNYESIHGNYEHVMYQKNILSNFISQIPSHIKIDDYVTIIYNSFNFSNKEIEFINSKRLQK
ncbi:conserved Plasmodium protein, unknown function [Plasmodium vinckei lentum]|uniref:GRIP domain-containing protein n=1 Tax=Plasmodium vinckei lentum TaxID=138297 RepID=A0A6V7RVE4_PLAVN|nr:conserved Plasmodium protein, unknown function [Plasmodium vinckei lentum]